MGRHCGPWFPCPYATHADLGYPPLTHQMHHAGQGFAGPPMIPPNAPQQQAVSRCLAPPARLSTNQGDWGTITPTNVPNHHNPYNQGPLSPPNIPTYQASATYNQHNAPRYTTPSTNIPTNNSSAPFPPSTLPFRTNPSSSNNNNPPPTLPQHPEALMRRLNDLLFAFHGPDSTTPKDAQNIAKLLKREFEAPIQLAEPCGDANNCAVLQRIVEFVSLFGFEDRQLGLVPMVSGDGRVLTVFVAGET
jgi:hypothetical protein